MTEISFENTTLEQLIIKSPLILVVQPRLPANSREEVPIHVDSAKYPPFVQVVFHYTVVEVIRGQMAVDIPIDVVVDHQLLLHEEYYLKGYRKSPIYPSYTPHVLYNEDETQIIFIYEADKDRYRFVVVDAIEGVAMREKIVQMVHENTSMY